MDELLPSDWIMEKVPKTREGRNGRWEGLLVAAKRKKYHLEGEGLRNVICSQGRVEKWWRSVESLTLPVP